MNADGSLKVEAVSSIDEITDEDFTAPMRNVQLPELPKNVAAAIGTDGKPVVIKKNILKRNTERHPDVSPSQSRGILKAALYTPNLYGQNQRASRPYNWVLISVKGKDGRNKLVLLEVNHNKDFAEIVHWHFVEDRAIEKIKKQAEREGGQLLILPSVDTEEAGALSGRPSGSASESKGNIKSTEKHDDEINHYESRNEQEAKGKPRDNGDTRARIVKSSDVSGAVDVKAVAAELQDKFGVEVEVIDSLDGVKDVQARMAIDAGINIKGWYDPKTGKVCIYAPNAESAQDVMVTYAHEVVAHKGMRGLLGKERYEKLCKRLGAALTPEQRELVREYIDMGKSDGELGDEYIARIAEMLIDEKGEIKEPTTWEKVKGAVRDFFRDVLGLELTDADIRYLLWRSGERLRRNKADVFTRAQDAVTGQQLGQQAETQRSSRLRFIGEKGAARADQSEEVTIRTDNLRVAQEMETAGKAAKNIKLATGWERGVDGSWRYEENDDGIKQLIDNYFAWEEGRTRKIDALNREWFRRIEEYDKACKSRRKYWREKSIKTGKSNRWGEEEILTPLEMLKNEISALEDYRNRYIDESRKTKIKDLLPANSLLLIEYPELREVEFGIFFNLEEGIYGQLTRDLRTKSTVKIELKRTLSKNELYRTLAHEVQHAIQLIEGFATGSNPIRAGSFDRYREHAGEVEARNVSRRMDMSDEQRRSSLAGDTEDVARNNQIVSLMGSGNSLMTESERNETMSRVNDAFNTQLRSFAPETADKTIFKLGRPSDILIAAGVVDKEMKLYGSKLLKKIREHGLALREIKDLPLSIASPIAVFDNHRSGSNRAILTELRTVDGNILVTIEVGKGGDVDFNIVSSVFGKRGNSVVNWINKGYATYIDKEKALSYLHLSAPIAEATESQELSLAAKVIQKFENPKTERENPPKDAHFNSSKQGDLFQRAQDVVTGERLQDESMRMRQEEADYQREIREITERAKADGSYDTSNDDIRFAIGKKRKDDMRKGLLNKLTNASEEQVEQTITEIEKLGEQSPTQNFIEPV